MVIVFRDKIEMIDKPDRLLEARMQESLRQECVIEKVEFVDEGSAGGTKFSQEIGDVAGVVICIVGFAILQIGRRELGFGLGKIVEASTPERFEVAQMADLFLDRPFFIAARDEAIA
jgi:hypothetical protein